MTSIREIRDSKLRQKYQELANSLNVSPQLLSVIENKYSTNFLKIIKTVKSTEELNNVLKSELISNKGNSFYDYSILLGLHFGIYNLYCYKPLSESLINKTVGTRPNREDTIFFFNNYIDEISKYLNREYNLEKEEVQQIIDKMNSIIYDYSLYNNDIVTDIVKLLIGTELLYSKNTIKNNNSRIKLSIVDGSVIEYFDYVNNQKEEIPYIVPRK